MQLQELPLDANDILQRVANADMNLYNRVIAEAQRDKLLAMVNEMAGETEEVLKIEEDKDE